MKSTVFLFLFIILSGQVLGGLRLATPFNDRMVLQRDREIPVWGTADPNADVEVRFGGQSVRVKSDASGRWRVGLRSMKASKDGRELVVRSQIDNKCAEEVRLGDVLVGEVWFASGQSNMDCPIWGGGTHYRDGNGTFTIQMSVKPFVRLVKVPCQMSLTPKTDDRAVWHRMVPQELNMDKVNRMPSAVGYYYALELANALDIPIGLVDASWGGTNIDAWTPRSGTETRADLADILNVPLVDERGWKSGMRKYPFNKAQDLPGVLWNGMVAAYVPMAMRGLIWYQGCHNMEEHSRYASKMHALYNGWSKEFGDPSLKLYFVQLAPWGHGPIAEIQEAQSRFAAEEKNAAISVISDLGNLSDVHPNQKHPVARRLAAHALKRDYGYDWIEDDSPVLRSWRIEKDSFILKFDHVESWYVYNPDKTIDTGFEICGADGLWKKAEIVNWAYYKPHHSNEQRTDGSVKGRDLQVRSKEVKEPKRLRYLHSRPWFGALYNQVNLPLGAFHCGDELVSSEWRATLDGRPTEVLFAEAWRGEKAPDVDPGGDYGILSFDWGKPVELEVRVSNDRDLSSAELRPALKGVSVLRRERDRIVIRVNGPCKFAIEPNEYERPLFVFAEATQSGVPCSGMTGLKAFGPGLHRVPGDILKLGSGETLYLERGAILQAAVYGEGENIRICGRGVIDVSRWTAKKGPQFGTVRFRKARNVTVEDVIVRGSYHWTVFVENCDELAFRNVKVCGGRCPNDDGLDIANSRKVTVSDCFFRTQDDCIAVKGLRHAEGPTEQVRIERCLFSCSFARILAVGHESRAPRMKGVSLSDSDVIHYVRPLLLVEPGDGMEISDVSVSNVRVHADDHGRSEAFVRIQPVLNGYTKGPGKIRNVSLSSIDFTGRPLPLRFLVRGADDAHDVRGISFSDLWWNGRKLDGDIVACIRGRAAAKGVHFDGEFDPQQSGPALQLGPFVSDFRFNGRAIR